MVITMEKKVAIAMGVLLVLLLSIFNMGNSDIARAEGVDMTDTLIEGMELNAFVLSTGNNTTTVKQHTPTVIGAVVSEEGIHALDVNITNATGHIWYEWNITTDWSCHWYYKVVFDMPVGQYWLNVSYALNKTVYDRSMFWVAYNETDVHTYFEMSPENNVQNITFEYLVSDEHRGFFESGNAEVNITVWKHANFTLETVITAYTEDFTLDEYGMLRGWLLLDLEPCHYYIVTLTIERAYAPDILVDADGMDMSDSNPTNDDDLDDLDRGNALDCDAGDFVNLRDSVMGLQEFEGDFMPITRGTNDEYPSKITDWLYIDINNDGAYTIADGSVEPLMFWEESWDYDEVPIRSRYHPSWDFLLEPHILVWEDTWGDPFDEVNWELWTSLWDATNSHELCFNDTDADGLYDYEYLTFRRGDTRAPEPNEDIWLDNGNGVWDETGGKVTVVKEHHTIHYIELEKDFTYEFQHRWNLRGNVLDEVMNTTTLFDLFDNITSITYKNANGDWVSVVRDRENETSNWSYYGDQFDIPVGYGFMVYADDEVEGTLSFKYQYMNGNIYRKRV